jgi:oligogalacturonide lyase
MGKGSRLPSEAAGLEDAQTGAAQWQVTQGAAVSHNLYFLSPSILPDRERLVFASYRDGRANFYCAPFRGGDIVQLTDADGINGYSAVFDRRGRTLFYARSGEVRALDLDTLAERVLATFEGHLGELSLNADESFLVAAMRTPRGFSLAVVATDGSGGRIILESPRTLIHPQFHPVDRELIEYAADPAPRMWLVRADGRDNECLWQHEDTEFLVHETFLGEGQSLAVVRWPYALQRFDLASRRMSTIAQFNAWHIAPSRDGRFIVCDTTHPDNGLQIVATASGERQTLCHPASSNRGSQWVKDRYAGPADFAAAAALTGEAETSSSWLEMKTDTVYGPQSTHPHPSWSPDERYVCYTSDRTGTPQVYVAELPERLLKWLGQ